MTSVELTPKQQADVDLLSQSGMGGLFFTIGAVALSAVEPLIWQSPWVAAMFLSLLALMMGIRLYLYFTLSALIGFVLPKIYCLCLLGNAAVCPLSAVASARAAVVHSRLPGDHLSGLSLFAVEQAEPVVMEDDRQHREAAQTDA